MSYRIEDVLESVQEDAPAPRTSTDAIIAGARRIQVRRRWAAVASAGGAAVVTVAVVAGITGTIPRASAPSPPAASTPSTAPSPAAAAPKRFTQPKGLEFTVATTRTGKFQIGPAQVVSYGHQEFPVYRDGRTIDVDGVDYPVADGVVTLYRPGIYTTKMFGFSELKSERYGPARKVTVAGRPGLEREFSYSLPDMDDFRLKVQKNERLKPSDPSVKQFHFTRTALAWQYDGSAWATFLPWSGREPLSRAESLAIAEAVEPQAARPVRAPYTFDWIPPGLRAIAAEQSPEDVNELISKVSFDINEPTGREIVYPAEYYPAGGEISVWHGRPKPENAPGTGQNIKCVDVNGYCTMVVDDEYHVEFQKIGKGLTMDTIRRILRGMRFTDLKDQRTWKPLS